MASKFVSVVDIVGSIRAGKTTASDVLEQDLARIDSREAEIHAFNHIMAESARANAASIDADLKSGKERGPLAGVPIALKDNMCTPRVHMLSLSAIGTPASGPRSLPALMSASILAALARADSAMM